MVTALAALEAGVVTPDERIVCPGGYMFGSHRFRCWKSHGPASTLHHAIKSVLRRLFLRDGEPAGHRSACRHGRALGLGKIYDTELPGVKEGIIPDTAWKRQLSGNPGIRARPSVRHRPRLCLATPLQLALVAGRIASGKAISPRFVRSAGQTPLPDPLSIDPVHLDLVRAGMAAVVNEKGGTAARSR